MLTFVHAYECDFIFSFTETHMKIGEFVRNSPLVITKGVKVDPMYRKPKIITNLVLIR